MSGATNKFRKILIFPKKDFGCEAEVAKAAGIELPEHKKFLFFNYTAIAIILDWNTKICWFPTLFLLDKAARSGSVTGDTVRTYSESLLIFLNFLNERGLCETDVSEMLWGSFRAAVCRGPTKYARATANLHLTVAATYLRWGQETRRFRSPMGHRFVEFKSGPGSPNWNSRQPKGRTGIVQLPSSSRQPRFVSPADFQCFTNQAPLPYRLQFKWAICTGLRRFEICALQLHTLTSAVQIDGNQSGMVQLQLERKGGRIRSVYVPRALIDETRWYALLDRGTPLPGYEDFVFLTSRGTPVSRRGLTEKFHTIATRNNIPATLHHLRHTFAIHVLARLQRLESDGEPINALKALQILMGHSSLQTTEIYLDAMEVTSDAVADTLGYLYGASV